MTELVTLSDPRSPIAEAYRGLRTNLSFMSPGSSLGGLLVTSPGAGEDKSLTLANLAVVVAQSGRRLVVIDADLRRPSQHQLFGLGNDRGLSTALADDGGMDDVPLQATAVDGLSVLTSGPPPPNPAELLASRRMAEIVDHLRSQFDMLLVDAPPVVPVTDAAILAPQLDGVLLVLASGRSRRDQAARARDLLDRVGARILGVVLTGVAPDSAGYDAYTAEAAV